MEKTCKKEDSSKELKEKNNNLSKVINVLRIKNQVIKTRVSKNEVRIKWKLVQGEK